MFIMLPILYSFRKEDTQERSDCIVTRWKG
jgi:hypothetical protein